MSRYRLKDVLAGTRGELRGSLPAQQVFPRLERDARKVQPGDLYIAIKGEVFDGNAFTLEAAGRGAAAAIVSRWWADANPESPIPLIVVEDSNTGLQEWAKWQRDRLDITVVGITGSIGKTSAKESIAAVLSQSKRVFRSPGNFNNEIGLPLSLLEAPADAEVVVLEMGGAYAHNELTMLAGIAQPQVGVVTNVFPVHLERMGTIEAIAETKSELVKALPSDGIAVLNGDDFRVRAMEQVTDARVVMYGLEPHNTVRAEDVTTDGLQGTSFWCSLAGERYFMKVPFVGAHGVQVALVAIAVGYAFGMHISEILAGLQNPGTQVRLMFVPGPNGSNLIDDTYNASTPSVLSALGLLREIPAKRRIAVLGEMRELGRMSEDEHRVVGRRAGEIVDILYTYGAEANVLAEEANTSLPEGRHVEVARYAVGQKQQIIDRLRAELREGDVVLFKGSRGLEMETLVQDLRRDMTDQPDETTSPPERTNR